VAVQKKRRKNHEDFVEGTRDLWVGVSKRFRATLRSTAKIQCELNRTVCRGLQGLYKPRDFGYLDGNEDDDAISGGLVVNAGVSDRYKSPYHQDKDVGVTVAVAVRCK
jgi:hypothetical protein